MKPDYQAKRVKYAQDKRNLLVGFIAFTKQSNVAHRSKVEIADQIPVKEEEIDQLKSSMATATLKANLERTVHLAGL